MLTFRNTNIVFLLMLAVLVVINITIANVPFWIYVILGVPYSAIVFYGCISIQSNFFIESICSLNTSEKVIAISFDDGPIEEDTLKILKVLADAKIEAAFFCIGKNVEEHKNIIRQIISEGHIIGNHSYSHDRWFDFFSAKKMLEELQLTDKTIRDVTGHTPMIFRPPYGVINPNLKKAIVKGKYISIGWSVRSFDTVTQNKEKLFDRVSGNIHPGAIYLFHDTCKSTQEILPYFIEFVKENGYRIVRFDKVLNLAVYA